MENVVAFNNELSGLYDSKPPISKAKMAAITKAAMRAIKFYKHVVQSVEKFILKCKPEYKVPGLYVIDSIVRQSRQQFGPEKDVFAPRFARNITETFANLFRCAPDDKSRIIRVLNLWQKNSVFAPEVIQPIFDLADPNHPIYQLPPGTSASNAGLVLPGGSGAGMQDMSSTSNGLNMSNNAMDISMSGGGVGMQHAGGSGGIMDDKLGGLPDLSNNNLKQLLQDPNVLRQLQTLQNFQKFKQQEEKQHKLNEMRLQEEAFEKHLQNVLKGTAGGSMSEANEYNKEVEFVSEEQKIEVINLDGNDSRSPTPERDRYKRNRRSSRSRSRSRSRDRRDRDRRSRRSRSRSRSRSPRSSNRRRSSRDRDRDRSNRDKERDREHDRERRKKGLPDLKKEHLSVCSTTLWVGHLSKLVYQEELSDTFGEFGDIVSIDQIVPRGCAFIVMNRRQDAYKAMQSLKNHKLQGRTITISWAAGKGVKSKEWKDYWDLDLGVTYIPWSKINEKTDFDSLEEGGMFDDDSMPSWMKDKINRNKNGKEKAAEQMPPTVPSGGPVSAGMLFGIDTTQPPPGPPPPGGPPPMAMPMGMPGQFTMAPPMGAPPRMLGPMGMPIAGIHMPPNMVPGMPPMLGMMPPGFPPMPGQAPAGPMGTHLGMPPGATQFPPPPTAAAGGTAGGVPPPLSATGVSNSNISNDDQMDIEMEDDDGAAPGGSGLNAQLPNAPPAMNFSQPPPMFGGNPPPGTEPPNLNDGLFNRDRQRGGMNEQRGGPGGGNSRWGGRGGGVDDGAEDNDNGGQRWRENGGSFNEGGGRMAGGRGGGGPMNIQAIDGAQQRPDFMNEFDGRGGGQGRGGGGGGRGAGNHNGDFYGNMPPNRFNQPTSLMQMRIPPPNAFNQRMGGPGGGPMFMRGGGQGGNSGGQVGAGGRPQGPGFFNPRNPFGRDNGEAGGRGGGGGGGMNSRGGRGGGGRGGRGNNAPPGVGGIWSDEEGDDSMNNFKRRGGGPPGAGPPGVNRFRDNRDNDDRNSRDRGGARGGGPRGMGGPGNRFERDSNERDRERSRDRDRDRDSRSRGPPGTRRFSRDENSKIVDDGKKTKSQQQDTEEDWDQELEEYRPSENAKKQAAAAFNKKTPAKTDATPTKSTATTTNAHDNQKKTPIETSETAPAAQASSNAEQEQANEEFAKPTIAAETAAAVGNKNNDVPSSPVPAAAAAPIATTTPLYDELPAAGFKDAGNDKAPATPQAKHTPQEQPPATTPKVVEVTQAAAAEFVPTPTKPIETQPAEIISDSITTTTTKTSAEATTTNSMSAVNEPKHVTAVDVSDVTVVGTLKESAPEETAAEN